MCHFLHSCFLAQFFRRAIIKPILPCDRFATSHLISCILASHAFRHCATKRFANRLLAQCKKGLNNHANSCQFELYYAMREEMFARRNGRAAKWLRRKVRRRKRVPLITPKRNSLGLICKPEQLLLFTSVSPICKNLFQQVNCHVVSIDLHGNGYHFHKNHAIVLGLKWEECRVTTFL